MIGMVKRLHLVVVVPQLNLAYTTGQVQVRGRLQMRTLQQHLVVS